MRRISSSVRFWIGCSTQIACGSKTKCVALRGRGLTKCFRGHKEGRQAAAFDIADVVHTARRTGTSIGQCFDHEVALTDDLLLKRIRSNARIGRFGIATYDHAGCLQPRCQPVEEDVPRALWRCPAVRLSSQSVIADAPSAAVAVVPILLLDREGRSMWSLGCLRSFPFRCSV